MGIQQVTKIVQTVGKEVSHAPEISTALKQIFTKAPKAEVIYEKQSYLFKELLNQANPETWEGRLYLRQFFETRLLEQEFCENLSKIYGVKFNSFTHFKNSGEIFEYFLAGSEINPVTKTIIPQKVRNAINADFKKLSTICYNSYDHTYYDGEIANALHDLGDDAKTAVKHKFYYKLSERFYRLRETDNSEALDRIFKHSKSEKFSFLPSLKLRTSRLNLSEAVPLQSEHLRIAEETSQKAKRVPFKFLQNPTPYLEENRELRLLGEKLEKEAAIAEKEAQKAAEQARISKMQIITDAKYNNMKLANENIIPYGNEATLNRISRLKGKSFEVAQSCKDNFLREMGHDPQLIKVEKLTPEQVAFSDVGMVFNLFTGNIAISPFYSASTSTTAALVRHELDHFELFASLCKALGVDKYKRVLLKSFPAASEKMFNAEFWERASKNAKDLSPAEVKKYLKALYSYVLPTNEKDIYKIVAYHGNPIETRAIDMGAMVSKGLGSNSSVLNKTTLKSIICRRILRALDRIEKSAGEKIDKAEMVRMLYNEEVMKIQGNTINQNKILNNVLCRLENMC